MSVSSESPDGRGDRIMAAALSTLNADAGASMARIAEAAGISRATLHRRFATRDDLVLEIGRQSVGRWEATLRASDVLALTGAEGDAGAGAAPDPDVLRAALDALVRRYVQDAQDFGFALTNPEIEQIPELAETCLRLIALETRVFVAAQRVGVLRDDQPAEWIGHVLFGLLKSGLDARRYGDVAPRTIPDLVAGTFFAAAGR